MGDGAGQLAAYLFCEDRGHELFARAMLRRLAREEARSITVRTLNGRGGRGRTLSEFKRWQRVMRRDWIAGAPDLLVLLVDGNCIGWSAARDEVTATVDSTQFPLAVIGCPDPHVERWCMADPESFKTIVGGNPPADPGKCDRDVYKRLLEEGIRRAGQPVITGPMELAPDLVAAMDLYRAGKNQASLKHFVEDLRSALRSLPNEESC